MDKNVLELASRPAMLSLEKLSLIKVTTMLSNNQKLLVLVVNFPICSYELFRIRMKTKWKDILLMANDLLSQVCLSDILKRSILEYLYSVSYRILSWKVLHAPFSASQFIRSFYWTGHGRIDNRRTLQSVVRNEKISFESRFILACCACLSEEIREMCGKMSRFQKENILKGHEQTIGPILRFWVHTLEGSGDTVNIYFIDAVMCAVKLSLMEAVEYFFSVSAVKLRRFMAVKCMIEFRSLVKRHLYLTEEEIDIGYFLFSQMTLQNQIKFSTKSSMLLLLLLLRSSEEKILRNFLTERFYSYSSKNQVDFLSNIFQYYRIEVINHISYETLFFDVLKMLPYSTRCTLDESKMGPSLLVMLLLENFPFLLKKDARGKLTELTSSDPRTSTILTQLQFHRGKWNFLHKLVLEEVIKIDSLKRNKTFILHALGLDLKVDKTTWIRIIRFVSKIGNNISK